MTRLLVSVRNVAEAEAALAGGANLIDVKEPLRGPLGAADAETIAAVVAAVNGRAPTSAALGELAAYRPAPLPTELNFAKLGLAGANDAADWPRRWARALESLPAATRPVAVVYADWRSAAAPPPRSILAHAGALRCAAVLIDTFAKADGDLFAYWPVDDLRAFAAEVREAGLMLVLAGSLTRRTIPAAVALAPGFIAVRGAVCGGERASGVDERLVRELSLTIRDSAAAGESFVEQR